MCCENSTLATNETNDSVIRITQSGETLAVLCETCVQSVKTFKATMSKQTKASQFAVLQFIGIDTFENDDYKERIDADAQS
jgi:hypothetical protein